MRFFLIGFLWILSWHVLSQEVSTNPEAICEEVGFETGNGFYKWVGLRSLESGIYGIYYTPQNWQGDTVDLYNELANDYPTVIYTGVDNSKPRFELIHKSNAINVHGDTLKDSRTNVIKLVGPSGSDYILRLGNDNRNIFSEKISYRFVVSEATRYISYYYAFVLEDPGHDGRPYFYAVARNINNDSIIPCSDIHFEAKQDDFNDLGKIGNFFYKDWSENLLDFSGNIGDTVEISFISSDCRGNLHFGYAYLDLACAFGSIDFLGELCTNKPITLFSNATGIFQNEQWNWGFGDGDSSSVEKPVHSYRQPGAYEVELTISRSGNAGCAVQTLSRILDIKTCINPYCTDCITSFSPMPGRRYLLSAWVKEPLRDVTHTFLNTGIRITYNDGDSAMALFRPSGPVIDGWQRIEQSFTIPAYAYNIQVELVNESEGNDAFFDDIRIHPFQSNMKSFVYDPSTQQLVAELDENNYATYYEYDDEGILIRVKKETERGIMTIKESRNNQSKLFKD